MNESNAIPTASYAALSAGAKLAPYTIHRRQPGQRDVLIDIDFCGVCHTDLHMVNNDWGMATYPLVPGHEIIGRVKAVGPEVTDLKVGQRVGVGCLVDSCGECAPCKNGEEQYCQTGMTMTYASPTDDPGGMTYGGYSRSITVTRDFVLTVPDGLDPSACAPLLCAGITTYSPLRRWNVGAGSTVGVIGLGGLGHMGIKLARAMGAQVVMITTSASKAEDARRLGADEVLLSTDADAMAASSARFNFLLNTIPVPHDFNHYMTLLSVDGTMCIVGAIGPIAELNTMPLVFGRRSVAGSLIGGLRETQEMLDFCGEKGVTADVELIAMDQIGSAYERMKHSDVKYRFVIDLASLEAAAA
jgi:alcohol dehydrogenase (NADP+)